MPCRPFWTGWEQTIGLARPLKSTDTDIPDRIMKVNHAGEFGAINIYRAQILIANLFRAGHAPLLREFLRHEKEHHRIFEDELRRRGARRCRSYLLCGLGGFVLGTVSGLLGRTSVLACTAAVESIVVRHLREQLAILEDHGDVAGCEAVNAIISDEEEHLKEGMGTNTACVFDAPYRKTISACTELVIWLGMRA